MPTLHWDALGGDPVPGDPKAFHELSHSFSETAENASSARAKLNAFSSSVDVSIWRGEAAEAFREKIGKLVPHLQKLHDSYEAASEGMGTYGRVLEDLQAQARALLGRAQAAQAEKTAQEWGRDRARPPTRCCRRVLTTRPAFHPQGRRTTREDLVDSFASITGGRAGTVDEQKKFSDRWLRSLQDDQ